MSNFISDKDKKDWDNFLSKKETLPDKDSNKSKDHVFKTKSFDLHGYSLDQANEKIENLIKESFKKGIRKLIIVTGKGIHSKNEADPYVSKKLGILKYSVPEFIKQNQDLMKMITEITEASHEDGGSGAFYIFLKKFKE